MNVIVQNKLIKLSYKSFKQKQVQWREGLQASSAKERAELLLTWLLSECICWFEITHPTYKKFYI
jgi:hypothetical protein